MTRVNEELIHGINFDDSFDPSQCKSSYSQSQRSNSSIGGGSEFEWDEPDSVILAAVAQQTKRIGSPINTSPKIIKFECVTSPQTSLTKNMIPGRGGSSPVSSPIKPGIQRNRLPSSSLDHSRQFSTQDKSSTRNYSAVAVPEEEIINESDYETSKVETISFKTKEVVYTPDDEYIPTEYEFEDVYEDFEDFEDFDIPIEDRDHVYVVPEYPEAKTYESEQIYQPKPQPKLQPKDQPKPQPKAKPKFKPPRTTTRAAKNHTIQFATQKPTEETSTKTVKPIILSQEQELILAKVMEGKSIFYTGSAGTGKSVLLRSIIKNLNLKYPKQVAVTASTGLAACNIGGTTLHRFAGFGLGQGKIELLIKKIRKNRSTVERWTNVKVLIIDEISMIDGNLLNTLNTIAKKLRKNDLPFGGIQLVVCGDFHQLPPVVKRVDRDGSLLSVVPDILFAFDSLAWEETIQETYILKEIFRQKGDQIFIDMLNEMRYGKISKETVERFAELQRPLKCPDWIVPTQLYATRMEVENANKKRLDQLPGEKIVYTAKDGGVLPEGNARDNLLDNFLAPKTLALKKDAQVICIKNFDDTLVNGSLGQVIDFLDKETYLRTKDNDNDDYIFSGIKEGTIDFLDKETYLRTKDNDNDDYIFSGIKEGTIDFSSKLRSEDSDRKKKLSKMLDEDSDPESKKCPVVRFLLPDGINTRTVVIEPEKWTVEDDQEQILVYREQLPLMLAWSLSIHKSQGQTLQKVKVDLKRVFEHGQSYVALSRAVSREGLQVLNFDPSRVRSHPRVARFYHLLNKTGTYKRLAQSKLNFPVVSDQVKYANASV